MNDFASAAMVRILMAGMQQEGLQTPAPPPHSARVPLAFKRQLVESAVAQGGWGVLPRLGRGLKALEGAPIYQALAVSRSPPDLVARWCRMERYVHSRHRVRGVAESDGVLALNHIAVSPHPPPLPAENLVVMGVIAAALEVIGTQGLVVHMGERGTQSPLGAVLLYPQDVPEAVAQMVGQRCTAQWRLSWQGMTSPAPPATNTLPGPALALTRHDPPPVLALRQILLTDLVAPPGLHQVAHQMGRAARSLQRELAGHGQSYSALVAQTRCLAAAWYLVHTRYSTAETGFMCGFSDQAHFTRTFTQAVGLPPARYRKEFELSAATPTHSGA